MVNYESFVKRMASKVYAHDRFTPNAIHGVMGVSTEAAELMDLVRKGIFYGKDVRPDQILDEAGDVLWFLALTLQQYGYTIEDAKNFNVTKLEARHGKEFNQEAVVKIQNRDKDYNFKRADGCIEREQTVWDHGSSWQNAPTIDGLSSYRLGPVPVGAYERMVKQG